MIDEHSLINASLCSIASGPTYTYTSGGNSTIIDYIVSNADAFREISSCSTLEEHFLNTSDHLLISWSLNLTHIRVPPMPLFPSNDLDWSTAVKEHSVLLYSNASDDAVRPLLSKDYSSINDLNQDILLNVQSSANMHIPAKIKKPQHTEDLRQNVIQLVLEEQVCF